MKNYEKYEKEIKRIFYDAKDIAFKNGNIVICEEIECEECEFNVAGEPCKLTRFEWMISDYVEPPEHPTLTPEEIRFCEVLPDYWLARDSDDTLWLFADKPYRASDRWDLIGSTPIEINTEKVKVDFKFISWQTDAYNTSELTREVNK